MFGLDRYQYNTNESRFDYEFESDGPHGIIKKVARFTVIGENIYNFGFGDLNEDTGNIDDIVRSNNGDAEKIMGTLGNIIFEFSSYYLEALVFIKGTGPVKTRFYQMNINKYWEKIDPIFEVQGFRNNGWEPFRKSVNYEAFLGHRKTSFLLV